jgi:hypothetical protein
VRTVRITLTAPSRLLPYASDLGCKPLALCIRLPRRGRERRQATLSVERANGRPTPTLNFDERIAVAMSGPHLLEH